jgi:hypothetical protein
MSTIEKSPDNVLGAVVFFLYILAALGLTALISSDLVNLYGVFLRSKMNTSYRSNLVLAFAAFAVISFSSLSYHLLSVLIYSYAEWAEKAHVPLPQTFFGAFSGLTNGSLSFLNIWAWAKSSTLFQDFAEVVCNDAVRFWWTQQALLLSIGWNTFMAIEGRPRTCQIEF